MEPYLAALYGAGGAIVPDVLKLINDRFGNAPDWLRRWHYWLGAGLLVLLGAAVAWFSGPTRPIDAAALGYAAPAIVAALLGKKDGGAKDMETTMVPGGIVEDVSRRLPRVRLPIPEFVRGVRVAWALR